MSQVLNIPSAADQRQAEMMQRQARASAKLQMAGEFAGKILGGGTYYSGMDPELVADFVLELADHILTKFSLDNSLDKIQDVPGVKQ